MFQLKYKTPEGFTRLWRLNENWKFIIIGSVILLAVIIDQLTHILQNKRRTRRTSSAAAQVTAPSTPASA